MQLEQTTAKAELNALRYTMDEKASVHAKSLFCVAAMVGSTVLAARFPGLGWAAFLLNMFLAVRYNGYIHALTHAYSRKDRVPWLLELIPVAYSPFILGFTELRKVHVTHHKLETKEGDPDNFVISGNSKLWSFFKASVVFESWFFHAVKHKWLSERFWPAYLGRLTIFFGLTALIGWPFLVYYVLAGKVGTGISFFIFSYEAHVQNGKHGTYNLPLPPLPTAVIQFLIGRYAADPANLHAVHHRWPWVSCAKLFHAFDVLGSGMEDDTKASPPDSSLAST